LFSLSNWQEQPAEQKPLLQINVLSVRVMVFNVTFNDILAISWQFVLLFGETGVPRENHRLATNN
jgi:hypothetical protein